MKKNSFNLKKCYREKVQFKNISKRKITVLQKIKPRKNETKFLNSNFFINHLRIHIKGVLLTSSDNANTQSHEIKASEIKEIWKPISYISKAMPLPDISLESIQDKVDSLKTELDFILSFRAKK